MDEASQLAPRKDAGDPGSLPRRVGTLRESIARCGQPRWRKWTGVLMAAVLVYLVCQFRVYYTGRYPFERSPSGKVLYRVQKSTGIHNPTTFTYAAYYWGVLPVYSSYVQSHARDASIYSKESARSILVEHGETLRMDAPAVRWGARMNMLLQYPAAVVKGSPLGADYRATLACIHVVGLLLLTVSLWWYAAPPLFVVLPVLLASSEFVAYDITGAGKVLHVGITGAVYSLALLMPLLLDRRTTHGGVALRVVLLGLVLFVLINMRYTAVSAVAIALLAVLLYTRRKLPVRLGYCALLLCVVLLAEAAFSRWWDYKYEQACAFVEQFDGLPYRGHRASHHQVWHPIWCGLADFDDTFGYAWRDAQPEGYAKPILRARGVDFAELAKDKGYLSGMRIAGAPGYAGILREKVLGDILRNPGWYLTIVAKRAAKIMTGNEPPRINFGVRTFAVPFAWWLHLLTPILLLGMRLTPYAKLWLLALPTAAVPLLITTVGNQQYLCIAHLVALALFMTAVCTGAMALASRGWRGRRGDRAWSRMAGGAAGAATEAARARSAISAP